MDYKKLGLTVGIEIDQTILDLKKRQKAGDYFQGFLHVEG